MVRFYAVSRLFLIINKTFTSHRELIFSLDSNTGDRQSHSPASPGLGIEIQSQKSFSRNVRFFKGSCEFSNKEKKSEIRTVFLH